MAGFELRILMTMSNNCSHFSGSDSGFSSAKIPNVHGHQFRRRASEVGIYISLLRQRCIILQVFHYLRVWAGLDRAIRRGMSLVKSQWESCR